MNLGDLGPLLVGFAALITACTGLWVARRATQKTDEKLDTGNGHTLGQLAVQLVSSLEDHRKEYRSTAAADKQEMKSALEAHAADDHRRFDELAAIMAQRGLI